MTIEQLSDELETERMRLVACMTASIQNTETSKAERLAPEHPYWSVAYSDVCRAVDREMTLRAQKDAAYAERNQLVAALSKLLPAHLARHPDEDAAWEDDWRWIVVVNVPAGQMTWHIHDSEREMFNHLDVRADFAWDGHTTDEKYRRLGLLASWRDPIAAAVDAQLDPLKDELIAMGHRLQGRVEPSDVEPPPPAPHLYTCRARSGKSDPPADCDWPMCGCDPYADKVITTLDECGLLRRKGDPE
jgi:hypothetical protein